MSTEPSARPPGWYADETGVTRWWSGQGWTEHTSDVSVGEQGLRADVAAAKARMHRWTIGAGRELLALPRYLAEGEQVQQVAIGSFVNATGLLALTDRRLLFLKDGLIGKAFQDYPLGTVTSVAYLSGLVLGKLQLTVSGSRAEIANMDKRDGRAIADAIRGAMGTANAMVAPKGSSAASAPDVTEQLLNLKKLLDAGVLEEDEYAAKKTELLSRM